MGPSAGLTLLSISLWDPLATWETPFPAGLPAPLHEARQESREWPMRQHRGDHTWAGRKGGPSLGSVFAPLEAFLGLQTLAWVGVS